MKSVSGSERISNHRRREQHGGSGLKAIFYTAILVIGIFVAFKVMPPYVAEYQLSNKMDEQARFAVVNRYSEDQIRDIIYKEVQDLDIPAKREDIKITATQQVVRISVAYTVPVDLLVYSTELHFSPSSENKSIM
ncbi:MAG: hypothetical protein WBG02_13875 [Candidatus Acidiferrum sp.]